MEIEVCIDDPYHVDQVIQAGADRIELCNQLVSGGTTPSYGSIQISRAQTNSSIHVLIRPRIGDFIYSQNELELMIQDIKVCKDTGIDGVVIGVLDQNRQVHEKQLDILCREADGLNITFHRAFDTIYKPIQAIKVLQSYPIQRILSSGGTIKAIDGTKQLKQLVESSGHIKIMAGSGINANNCLQIVQSTGVDAVHFSAQMYLKNLPEFPLSSEFAHRMDVDHQKIQTIKSILK